MLRRRALRVGVTDRDRDRGVAIRAAGSRRPARRRIRRSSGPRRPPRRRRPGRPRAAAAEDRLAPDRARAARRGASRARRPCPTPGWPASSRAGRARRRSPRPRSSRRAPRRARRRRPGRPARPRRGARRGPGRDARGSRPADRREADVDGIVPRVGGDLGVRRPEERLAEEVGDERLADPRQAQRADRPVASRGRAPGAAGSASSRHIGRISRGGPGRVTMTRPSGRSTHQPGAVPFGLASGAGRRDEPGLLEVHLRERQPAAVPQAAQPGLEDPGRRPGSRRTRRRSTRGSGRPGWGRGRRS